MESRSNFVNRSRNKKRSKKPPIYKKWWFWVVSTFVVLLVVLAIFIPIKISHDKAIAARQAPDFFDANKTETLYSSSVNKLNEKQLEAFYQIAQGGHPF